MNNYTFDNGSSDRGWTDLLFRGFNQQAKREDPRNGGFDFFQDFRTGGLGTDSWTVTAVGSSTAVIDPTVNEIGSLLLTTGASDNDGVQAQHLGCVVTPAASKIIAVEWRVKSVALTLQNFFFGLAATDTTILASDVVSTADSIGFHSYTGDGVVLFGSNTTGNPVDSTTSPGTLTADTYAKIGFRLEGIALTGSSSLEVYFNGVNIANSVAAATIPNAAQRLSFAFQANTAVAKVGNIDWVRMAVQ